MRHLLFGVLVVVSLGASASALQQPPRADGVAALLSDVEAALNADSGVELARILSPGLSRSAPALFTEVRGSGVGSVRVVLRERERRPAGRGHLVTADLLITRDVNGRVATYELTLEPRSAAPTELEITELKRIAHLDGLVRLSLDTTRQYAVHNLQFTAPDLVLTMSSGTAFLASVDTGATALVLHGRGDVRFTPREASEQDQLRIFSRRPSIETPVDEVYIRVNPADLDAHLSRGALVPVKTEARRAARAHAMFDRLLPRSYSLTLGDLSRDRWSILPPYGNVAVEFKSRRYGWLTYARSVSDAEDITLFDRERARNLSIYGSAENVARRGRFYDEDANAAYDIVRYGVDVTFDPARSWMAGRGRLRLRILADAAQNLSFRLAEPLVVSSITSPELGRLLPLRVVGQTTLLVSLPETVTRNREITIDVAYSGRLEPQDLGSETARLDVLQDQDEPIQAIQRPEPRFVYSIRSYWYPQGLTTDFAPAAMRLTVPAEYTVVASGERIGESVVPAPPSAGNRGETKSQRTVEFVADRPIRYLACEISRFVPIGSAQVDVPAVAPAVLDGDVTPTRSDSPAPGVALNVLATPRQVNANRGLADRAAEAITFFATLIGEAPYPRLAVTAADAYLPGGHSPAFFALVQQPLPTSPYAWRQDPLSFDDYPDYLLAHEVAHQWWGQAVGFKNYHDQWLSEGLAQYGALSFLSAGRLDTERALVVKMRESAESLNDKGPIYLGYRLGHIEGRGAAFRAIAYNKAAVVLHMLRRFVGDEAFRRGLQRFYREWRFRKAGTDDLRAAFEAEAGRPLGRYFERWILGSALPKLRVTARVDERGEFAYVRVEQVGAVFDLPLTAVVQYSDGRTDEVTLRIDEAVTETRVALTGKVRRIVTRDPLTMAEWVD